MGEQRECVGGPLDQRRALVSEGENASESNKDQMESFTDLFAEWQTADKAARDAEASLFARTAQAVEGEGELPTPEEWVGAKRLRTFANYLLDTAIAKIRQEDALRRAGRNGDGGQSAKPPFRRQGGPEPASS
jgi:hypothetical protein